MKRGLGRGLESLMDRPAAEEPRTVTVTVSNADAPGLRQFLNRRADANTAVAAESETSAPPPVVPLGITPAWAGGALLAADAVVVVLSILVMTQGQTLLLQAIGCTGIVAGAALGVLGVSLWCRSR